MPTGTSSASQKRPRRRLRRLGAVGAAALLALGLAAWLAAQNLTVLARWALERAFPGAVVEIHRAALEFPNRLSVDAITLKSRRDGATLLALGRGGVTFEFGDLWSRQIGEVRLEQPVIHASPRLTEIFGSPGPAEDRRAGRPWSVRRLVCEYGELQVTGYGTPGLTVSAKFAFDLRNFSPATAPEVLHELTFWDVRAGTPQETVLAIDLIRLGFDFASLSGRRTLASLQLSGGSLQVGESLRALFRPPPTAAAPSPAEPAEPWTIGTLELENLKVRVDDRRSGLSEIAFAVNLSLKNIPLSQAASELGGEEQTVEISHLAIHSPLDPFTRVLTMDSLLVRFTLAGLLRKEIREITISGPAIHVGEDLFWYMETAQKNLGSDESAPGSPDEPGWKIATLRVVSGSLILGSGGRKQYGLPLNFRTIAKDIALDNLAALKLRAVLEIPPQKYAFASYQLEFTSEQGELRFSYPPEANPDNLVGVVRLKDIRWRQYRADDSWVSVTFDRQGINGTFGGTVYRGEATGGFSFSFNEGTPWTGWLSGKRVDLKQLTDIIAPQNVRLTGPLEFALQVRAKGKEIEKVSGNFRATRPGKLVISKLDDFLANIPESWSVLKQSGTRVLLEALRDFEYSRGGGNFQFANSAGDLRLNLQGPAGSRNFKAVLHANEPGQKKPPASRP